MTTHLDYPEMYLAFEMQRVKLVDSEDFRAEMLEYTNNCDADSLREAGEHVRQSEEIAAFYLSR